MKILFTSDLHSMTHAYRDFVDLLENKNYDLGIIAGDLGNDFTIMNELILMLTLTKKLILVIPGNHDKLNWRRRDNIYNIHWRKIKVGKYFFVGYRYTLLEKKEQEIESDLQKIKNYVDKDTIFVTHSPAYGILDEPSRIHIGSKALRYFIKERKPMLHLHGHAHLRFGWENKSINGAYYKSRKFISIDLETGVKEEIE